MTKEEIFEAAVKIYCAGIDSDSVLYISKNMENAVAAAFDLAKKVENYKEE